MKWFKILVGAIMIAGVFGLRASSVYADSPDYSNPQVVQSLMNDLSASSNPAAVYNSLSPEGKAAVQKYSKLTRLATESTFTDEPELGRLCRKRIESTSGYNYLGGTLWTFSLTVKWCWNGTQVTKTVPRVRGFTNIWPWEYQGLIHDDLSGGVGQEYYYRDVQGKMCNNLPTLGCVQTYYPYAWIEANNDGTSEGEADY